MGSAESKKLKESPEVEELRKVAEMGGPAEVQEYIKNNVDKWKTEKVKLAVTGMTKTGKSYFINKINGAKKGDPNFAPQGTGNTTLEPKCYQHSSNPNIEIYDLPGVGTELIKKETYIENMELHKYDFIFIFFDSVIQQLDVWLAEMLLKMKKPFCLVKSRIDLDIDSAEDDGRDPENVITEAREKALESFERNEILKKSLKLFIISSKKPKYGDFNDLISFLETHISGNKAQAITFALPSLTQEIVEKKYNYLSRRIVLITIACSAFAANPIPFLDIAINITIVIAEVRHYVRVFGLSKEKIALLEKFDKDQIKTSYLLNAKDNMEKLVLSGISKVATGAILIAGNVTEILIPGIGAIISSAATAKIVYSYLKSILDDIKHDATIVYQHIQREAD